MSAAAEPSYLFVTVEEDAWTDRVPEVSLLCDQAVLSVLEAACPALQGASVSLLLADDARVRELNRTYRDQDKPTNVLSFPATLTRPGETPRTAFEGVPLGLGDIVLAFETVTAEAAAQDKPIEHHLIHLVVHGTLHLLGYDHMTDDEAAVMEGLEVRILAGLGIADPYHDGSGPDGPASDGPESDGPKPNGIIGHG
ncbi:MAG TPA: rRNA maturation RNase YbeY [Stellaceae bacterium]|nr:rRNA maturation RNase YbeY [Stellaceae bacterium]